MTHLVLQICTIVLAVGLVVLLLLASTRRWFIRHLGKCALTIFLLGVAIYFIGFSGASGSCEPFGQLLIRSNISSVEMFVSHSDLAEIELSQIESHSEFLEKNLWYLPCFSLIHLSAILISAIFVINLLGRRFFSWMSMKVSYRKKRDYYVFWGINKSSFLLADSTNETLGTATDRKYVFIEEPGNEQHFNHSTSFLSLFLGLSHNDYVHDKLEDLNAYVSMADVQLFDAAAGNDSLWDVVGLKALGKCLPYAKSIRFFFLSDNFENNLQNMLALRNHFPSYALDRKNIHVYYHIPQNEQTEFAYYYPYFKGEKLTYHPFESAQLSIACLKMTPSYNPVYFAKGVDVNFGTVSESFQSIVLGFGRTGQEAVKFIYEYSMFVHPEKEKTPFLCDVYDQNMSNVGGEFLKNRPMLCDNPELVLHTETIGGEAFWNEMGTKLEHANYIVVAMGEDEKDIDTAVQLYKLAVKVRKNDLSHFGIFIRVYDDENYEKMQETVSFYNQSNKESGGKMVLFGQTRELFTYDKIVNEEILKRAQIYNLVYNLCGNRPATDDVDSCSQWVDNFHILDYKAAEELWNSKFITEKHGKNLLPSDSKKTEMIMLQERKRKMEQNYCASMHGATKMYLLGLSEGKSTPKFEELVQTLPARKENHIDYGSSKYQVLLDNIAKCEHLRWNASHILLGYCPTASFSDKTDEIVKEHNCLRPWDDLSLEIQSYDYNVVDTTILLEFERLKTKSYLQA